MPDGGWMERERHEERERKRAVSGIMILFIWAVMTFKERGVYLMPTSNSFSLLVKFSCSLL